MALWRDIVDRIVRARAQFGEPLALVVGEDMAARVRSELAPAHDGLAELCAAMSVRLVDGPPGSCLVCPAERLTGNPQGSDATDEARAPHATSSTRRP